MRILKPVVYLLFLSLLVYSGCGNRTEEVKNGVAYAKNALSQVNSNPFSQATYYGIVSRGGTPVDYIKAILPKQDPVFDSWEYEKPTRQWTIVIRPGTEPGEYWIEGYGTNLKQPIKGAVERVTVTPPQQE